MAATTTKPTIDQPITNRWTGALQFTAKIEADETTPLGVRIGLAVRWAIESDANLSGANLRGADLSGANLSGANLSGAYLSGEKIARVFARVQREIDPYTFMGVELAAGGCKVAAGCRWYSLAEFRAHVAKDYPDTDKAAETLAILDFIEARAAALGVALEPLPQTVALEDMKRLALGPVEG